MEQESGRLPTKSEQRKGAARSRVSRCRGRGVLFRDRSPVFVGGFGSRSEQVDEHKTRHG